MYNLKDSEILKRKILRYFYSYSLNQKSLLASQNMNVPGFTIFLRIYLLSLHVSRSNYCFYSY